jgi:deoxyribodipyrimidine photo-lyase
MEEGLYDFKPGKDYPLPIVNIEESGRYARETLFKAQKNEMSRAQSEKILRKHTSRSR